MAASSFRLLTVILLESPDRRAIQSLRLAASPEAPGGRHSVDRHRFYSELPRESQVDSERRHAQVLLRPSGRDNEAGRRSLSSPASQANSRLLTRPSRLSDRRMRRFCLRSNGLASASIFDSYALSRATGMTAGVILWFRPSGDRGLQWPLFPRSLLLTQNWPHPSRNSSVMSAPRAASKENLRSRQEQTLIKLSSVSVAAAEFREWAVVFGLMALIAVLGAFAFAIMSGY